MKKNLVGMNILLESYEEQPFSSSGLIVPGDTKKIACGRVVQKGPGILLPYPFESHQDDITSIIEGTSNVQAKFIPLDIEVGDIVYYSKEAAEEVYIENKYYIIIPYLAIKLFLRDENEFKN